MSSNHRSLNVDRMQQDLVALDPVLLDLVKLALELSLALQTFLRSAHVDDFPVDLLPIHFINCLEEQRGRLLLSLSTFGFFFLVF